MKAKLVNEAIKHLPGNPVDDLPEEQRLVHAFKTDDIEYIKKSLNSDSKRIRKLSKLYLSDKKISVDLSMRVKITKRKIDPTGDNNEITLLNFLEENNISYRYIGRWMGNPAIKFTSQPRNIIKFLIFSGAEDIHDMYELFDNADLLNESIKHLSGKSDEEIIQNIKGSHPYYQLYMAMEYGMNDLIQELLDKHEVKGNEEEDPFYMLASFYLTDEEISFKHSGSWKFENGEIICYSYDEDTDEICTDMKEFMSKHNITYKLIRTFSNRTAYVEFSGNASDIIKFVLQFFVFTHQTRADIILDDAYQIIFTG